MDVRTSTNGSSVAPKSKLYYALLIISNIIAFFFSLFSFVITFLASTFRI